MKKLKSKNSDTSVVVLLTLPATHYLKHFSEVEHTSYEINERGL